LPARSTATRAGSMQSRSRVLPRSNYCVAVLVAPAAICRYGESAERADRAPGDGRHDHSGRCL